MIAGVCIDCDAELDLGDFGRCTICRLGTLPLELALLVEAKDARCAPFADSDSPADLRRRQSCP